jgi:ABC-type Co2+ transport system permease subunit
LRAGLDQVVVRSTGGPTGDEGRFGAHQRPSAADERFADYGKVVIIFVFLLGIGNFTLHRAVLSSGHPALAQMAWLVEGLDGRASFLLEFALLFAALLLAAGGHPGWAGAYFIYSALNALAAWLILSRRM